MTKDYNMSMEKVIDRDKRILSVSGVGIGANVLLVAGKITVGLLARSVSIVADGFNNLTDAMSSIVTMIGTRISGKRPDKKHPFGHGRMEFVTASIIGILIFIAGFSAIYSSVRDLVEGSEPTYDAYAFVVIGIATAVKVALGLFFRYQGTKVNSDVLRASGTDALWDSVLSAGTLVGAGVSYGAGVHLEGYIGIAIGLFILKSAIDVFRKSISKIIGERADAELVKNMTADIAKHPAVKGVYDLIINNYGVDRNVAGVHVEVADNMTAREIQQMEREIAYMCYEKYHTVITVGVYAEHSETPFAREMREKVYAITAKFAAILQTHGFFIDEVNRTVSVDIIIDFDEPDCDRIVNEVKEAIEGILPDYRVIVIVDRDYTVS